MIKNIPILILVSLSYTFTSADAVGTNGIVVSSKIDATTIGIDILKKGGNAIDAAVAVGFALAVTHSGAGNIGGGGFLVLRLSDGTVTTLDFRETAPMKSTHDMFLDNNNNVVKGLSWSSILSSGVPGTVAGLGYIHEKYGQLTWEEVLYPSILLAKFGFPLDYYSVSVLNSKKYKNKLSAFSATKKIFTKDKDYQINEIFVQKDLSETLSRISKYGYKEFYFGKTADLLVSTVNSLGGIITHEDLRNYIPIEREPITFTYRDYNVFSMPLPSSGGITLSNILNQIENLDFNKIGYHSSDHVHYLVEAEKRAYADRALYLGDSDFVNIPDHLTSKEYALSQFETIKDGIATKSEDIYNPKYIYDNELDETTHFTVADNFGNAISVTTTLNGWYGNAIVVDGAGFLLNNEMDDFSIKPGYANAYGLVGNMANSIVPNKRMLSSMTPTILTDKNNQFYLSLGSPGGSTIITTVAQIINNIIDYDMDLDMAVESKRFHHQCLPDKIQLEMFSLPEDVINKLTSMGHDYIYRGKVGIGEANCIMRKNNLYYGSADSRRNSTTLAY